MGTLCGSRWGFLLPMEYIQMRVLRYGVNDYEMSKMKQHTSIELWLSILIYLDQKASGRNWHDRKTGPVFEN